MINHSKSVRLGVNKSLMVVDMPFNTYATKKSALKNAKKIIKETKCDAVKLEGGKKIYETIKSLVKNKIPVMGHLGLLPQSDKTFKFKGKKKLERDNILRDSQLLEKAGVFSIVLECVETSLAKLVTQNLNILTIGIGAGQMNRVGAAKIALKAAGSLSSDAVLASDGFFPFADTVELANEYGIKAIIQPGGSLRDQESIDMCNLKGISMVFTQKRHFLH